MPSSDFQRSIVPVAVVIVIVAFIAVLLSSSDEGTTITAQKTPTPVIVTDNEAPGSNSTTIVSEQDLESVNTAEAELQEQDEQDLTEVVKESEINNSPLKDEKVKDVPVVLPEKKLVEGLDYVTKFPDELPKEPLIMEFFSYMCPHCFNFEPTLQRWEQQKPQSVKLIKIPVSFGRSGSWGLAAKAYYIAVELNIVEKFSPVMFRKIHVDNKPPLRESDLAEIFKSLGISNRAYKKAANSFNVDSNIRKAEFMTKKYKVSGVPYFLINSKYETGARSFESEQSLFILWNNLPGKDF